MRLQLDLEDLHTLVVSEPFAALIHTFLSVYQLEGAGGRQDTTEEDCTCADTFSLCSRAKR